MIIKLLEELFCHELRTTEQPSLKKENEKPQKIKVIIPEQFKDDVEKLKNHVGDENWLPGLVIELTLQELLAICPRNRKRSDAYAKLIAYMNDELQITLKIKQKR